MTEGGRQAADCQMDKRSPPACKTNSINDMPQKMN